MRDAVALFAVGGRAPRPHEGIWYEEPSGVAVFSYSFGDVLTSDRLTVLSVDASEMRCRLARAD